MDKPLKSEMNGQCDARPTVTFPARGHHRRWTSRAYQILLLGDRGTHVCELEVHRLSADDPYRPIIGQFAHNRYRPFDN